VVKVAGRVAAAVSAVPARAAAARVVGRVAAAVSEGVVAAAWAEAAVRAATANALLLHHGASFGTPPFFWVLRNSGKPTNTVLFLESRAESAGTRFA
jgi:hypothetical protein